MAARFVYYERSQAYQRKYLIIVETIRDEGQIYPGILYSRVLN